MKWQQGTPKLDSLDGQVGTCGPKEYLSLTTPGPEILFSFHSSFFQESILLSISGPLHRVPKNDRQNETVSKPEIRLENDAGFVRRGSRTARNGGAVLRPAGRPYTKKLFGGHLETISSCLPFCNPNNQNNTSS